MASVQLRVLFVSVLLSLAAHAEPADQAAADGAVVTVSGQQPLLQSSARAPTAASTVVSGERLQRAGASSADVLQDVVGVDVQRTGASNSPATATIRGSDSFQTPVYVAGIRINDDVTGVADLSTVPLWMMQRVEVFRGNAPFTADRLGLSGAIFFEPKRPTRTRVGALAQLGSYGERQVWGMAEVGTPTASALIGLRGFRTRGDFGFWNDHGERVDGEETYQRRINSDATEAEAWSIGETHLPGGGRLTLLINALDREHGVTGVATTQARSARGERRRMLGGVSASLPCAPDGGCSLQLRSTLLEEQTTLTDPRIELRTLRAPWLHSRGQRVGHSIGLSLRPTSSWQLGVNAGYVDELLVLDRAQSSARRALRNGATLALDSQVRPTDAWLLYGMLHAQCERTHGSLQQDNGWNEVKSNECADLPEARLGSSMDLNPWLTVLANLSHNVRPPTLGERYGTSPTINGNAGLLREDSINADFGVRSTWASAAAELGLDAFAFGRWSKDLVRYRRTSLNAFSPYNVARGRVLGLEVDAAGRFWRYLEVRTGVTATQPMETTPDDVDTTPNDVLPLSSRLHLSQWLGVAAPWERFRLAHAALGLRYMFMSSRYLDPSGLVVLPAREDWSLAADLRWSRPDIAARLAIENVLNARQQDLIGLPLPGRTFHVALEAWW